MDLKTARKYLRDRRLPSEMRQKHTWRTRPDPFADIWDEIQHLLAVEPGLQAKTGSSSICSRCIRAGSVTARCGHCGGGLATGERPKGHHAKCSLRKSIDRATYINWIRRLPGTGRDHQWPVVSASDLSFCAELLELGDRKHLLFGERSRALSEGCRMHSGNWAGQPLGTSNGSDQRGGE